MVTERNNFMKKINNYEWSSLLDLTGKGLNQFNAVDQNLNCSQLMNNANLDWNVEMKPVLFETDNFITKKSDKFFSLVKDKKAVPVLVSQAAIYPNGRIMPVVMKGIDPGQSIVNMPTTYLAKNNDIKIPVLIVRNHKKNEKQCINLHTNRSHAQYIVDLLVDGSQNTNF